MNYTLHQLATFLKVTQTQNITKAAEEMCLSQPAVSIQLRNFQQQFDVPLLEVVGRKIYITDFGKEIALAASRILEEVAAIQRLNQSYQGLLTGKLTLSVVSTGKYVMPFFLSGFVGLHPGIELSMDVTNRGQVWESLFRNEVDFAFVSVMPDRLDLNSMDLMPNQLVWVRRKEQVGCDAFGLNVNLNESPVIFREFGSGTRVIMESFLEQRNIQFRKRLELSSNEAVKQAVMAGLGISLMPMIGIKDEVKQQKLEIIPIEGTPLTTHWKLVWRSNKSVSPVGKAFLAYLESEKTRIIEENFHLKEDSPPRP